MNSGSITAPTGIIGLVAVTPNSQYKVTPGPNTGQYTITDIDNNYDVQISDTNDHLGALADEQANITVNQGRGVGEVVNSETGKLVSDSGFVGMYGKVVNQNGLIRAVTAVKTGGMIELLASDKVSLGPQSLTICPISDTPDTADPSFVYQPGRIIVGGFNNQYFSVSSGQLEKGTNPAKQIVLQGAIVASSGKVTLEASDRIFLDTGSRIDVSGLWVDEPASNSLISAQLNSIQLRDDYGQKNALLKGQTISFNALSGSSIGDLHDYFNAANLTAREKSTLGGTIALGSNLIKNVAIVNENTTQEIIVKQGAELAFAGGGFNYKAGPTATTKLVSGNRIYDISNAPEWITYDQIIGQQQRVYAKYGVTDTFTGLYFGGGTPVKDYSPGYLQGSDAGSAALLARQIVLDGRLNGSATRGLYQNLAANPSTALGVQSADGLMQPAGGTLTIGTGARKNEFSIADFVVNEAEITAKANPLPAGFTPDEPIPQDLQAKTLLPVDTLNGAGLSNLSIYANTSFTMDAGAKLSLPSFSRTTGTTTSGATATFQARTIDFRGEIDISGGSVTLAGVNNRTADVNDSAFYVPLPVEEVFLERGSRIDVSGERIDNTRAGFGAATGHTTGGTITLSDNTLSGVGVLVKNGAVIDVSGGYSIDGKGKIAGGDAGTINLSGTNIVVNGDVRGLSLVGNKGGTIIYQSDKVRVSQDRPLLPADFGPTSPLSDSLRNGLVLNGSALAGSGFSQIELQSYNDVTIEPGITLTPSAAKLAAPVPGGTTTIRNDSMITASQDLVGTSSVTLKAGITPPNNNIEGVINNTNNAAMVDIPDGAGIQTAPGGTISLQGPNITISGVLTAPAGTISAVLSYDKGSNVPQACELLIAPTGRLNVQGYNKPIPGLVAGEPAGYTPMAGGSINLSAVPNSNVPDHRGYRCVKGRRAGRFRLRAGLVHLPAAKRQSCDGDRGKQSGKCRLQLREQPYPVRGTSRQGATPRSAGRLIDDQLCQPEQRPGRIRRRGKPVSEGGL